VVERNRALELSALHHAVPSNGERIDEANEMADPYDARAHRLSQDIMGTPITQTSPTAGCAQRWPATSRGEIWYLLARDRVAVATGDLRVSALTGGGKTTGENKPVPGPLQLSATERAKTNKDGALRTRDHAKPGSSPPIHPWP